MTDKEIIKALETKKEDMICAVVDENKRTHFITNKVVLDLITRQQAEIDELKHEREVLIEDIHLCREADGRKGRA